MTPTKKTPSVKVEVSCYCILCRKVYLKNDAHKHMQSMLHHRELENVKGRDCRHWCKVCKVSSQGLTEYAEHISTQSHGDKIKNPPRKTKPMYVEQDLDAELLSKVRERNKELHKMEKKKKRKKKKLNLKMEAQQDPEKQKAPMRKCPKQPKGKALKWIPQVAKLKLAKSKTPKKLSNEKKPQQKTSQPLSGKMVQNKENRLACKLKSLPPSQPATPQGQSGAQPPWPEFRGPPGGTCHPYSQQHTQSTLSQPHQVGSDENPPISGSTDIQSLGTSVRGRGFKASRPNTFHKNLRGAGVNPVTPPPGQLRWPKTSQLGYEFYGQAPKKTQDMDFTSDHIPPKGAIIFSPGEILSGSTTAPVSTSSSGPSGQGDGDKGRIRSVDVTVMLRQVRRALGVREPPRASSVTPTLTTTRGHCRGAEVEAEEGLPRRTQRTKRGEAVTLPNSSSPVSQFKSLPSTTSSLQSSQVSTTRSVASSETWPLPGNQAKRRSTRYPKVEETSNSQPTKEGEGLASDTYGPVSSQTNPQEGSTVPRLSNLPRPTTLKRDLTRHISKPGAHEPNLNAARRIRKGEKEKETGTGAGLKPTLKKLLSSAGSQRKVNWREMYQEANRKKQEKVKGMPRFGIELVNPLSDPEGLALDEDEDLPLTEGFQWESGFPNGAPPPAALPTPSLPQAMPASDVIREQPSEARTLGSEQPSTVLRDSRSSRAPQSLCVKTEPEQYREAGVDSEQRQLNTKRKKKRKVDSDLLDTSGVDQSAKKQKIKSNSENVQVDQLLAVSLMEEELSGSLQSLDTSLIQARNTLQVAYTEVQRLLLVKQQVTTEINGLRAKRIEILQGMQGAVAAATVPTQQPSLLPLSNLRIPSPTGPTSAAPLSPYPNLTPAYHSTPSAIPILNPTPSTSVSLPVKKEPATLNSQSRATPSRSPVISYPFVNPRSTTPVLVPSPLHIPIPAKPPSTTVTLPATTPPAVATLGQQRVVGSSTSLSTSTKQLRGRQKKQSKEKATRRTKSKQEDVQDQSSTASSTTSDSEDWEDQEGLTLTSVHLAQGRKDPLLGQENDRGKGGDEGDSDCYVETVTVERQPRSNMDVVAIDDSDVEEEPEAIVPHTPAPAQLPSTPPAPPTSVCVEVNSSGTQTVRVKEDHKDIKLKDTSYGKMKLPPVTVKEKHSPPKCADVADEQEPSLGSFEGHTGTVHDLQIHGGFLYTCSGDNTARAYCLVSKACQAVFEGHTNKINCLLVSSLPGLPARLYTGSSDLTIRCFSIKSKKCLEQISLSDRVLCLHIHWNILYVGLANGSVVSFEVKTQRQLDVFECHGPRGVSCLGTSQEGARRVLLVGSYDSTISVRDAKSGLLLRSLQGHTKTVLCMKVVNDLVFSGSSDTSVHAHNIHTGELVRIYKGHSHAVTALAILGKVMVTACLDKLVRVYELQSHDRLQVYGGHHDMVMCMAIHKSVIYTGCYDGTVQAVKLNLMQNYRCWWHSCSLIFGMGEHLLQHLLTDHSNRHLQTFRCRWRNCDAAFATQDSSHLDLPSHMQTHVEMDSKLKT
uniref:zinc finger protein 106 isoform X3 n=1 Tax=Oncorhynchus gorbuscha TaxID=8017 RepID=UPI001EAEEC64|nr:zinc finger protein 106 isoform X3 [Oncorhynchus gorbuscha]